MGTECVGTNCPGAKMSRYEMSAPPEILYMDYYFVYYFLFCVYIYTDIVV